MMSDPTDATRARGRLKIFFGASAGAGKTYAMLAAARQQLLQDVDVVIGAVDTHGRPEAEVMTDGFERLPARTITRRGEHHREFDLEAALARRPSLILMDELAHANVPGSRHAKRWQDIEDLLAAGIDVYTTVNVQNLESLNDVVNGITGIQVCETIPDKVFDAADEIVLVDLSPDELLDRLKDGKVHLPNQSDGAIRAFFRKGNLLALRELALRRTADRVDHDMLQYRRQRSVGSVWQTRESLLACIGPGQSGERIIRAAARMAASLQVPWHAIFVETPDIQRLPDVRRQRIVHALKMAQDMGAKTATLIGSDPVAATLQYAREHNLSRLVVGRGRPSFWQRSFADHVARAAPELEVTQVARREALPPPTDDERGGVERDWHAYAQAMFVCALVGLLATPLRGLLDPTPIVLIFLLAVVTVGVRLGQGPAALASLLAVGIYDFFFVPPMFSFAVVNPQQLLVFVAMLAVGLVVGQMTSNYKHQAALARRREQRATALYELARDLSAALLPLQIEEIGQRFLSAEFRARSALLVADSDDCLQFATSYDLPDLDADIAEWCYARGDAAGLGTETAPSSPILYLPLKAPMRVRGVLALKPPDDERLIMPEQRRLLDTCASLLAIAIERMHYVEVAQDTTVQMESERLRNNLLSAVSHDLRAPLSALAGLADGLFQTQPPLAPEQAATVSAMRTTALRLNDLVGDLLDMARLQAGRVTLDLHWQPLDEVVTAAVRSATAVSDRVKVQLDDDLPRLQLDAALFERALIKLLENAGQYTPAGSHIELGAHRVDRNVEILVEDHGPGLPSGKEEAMFDKFERGQAEVPGTGIGLGLAICRAIVESHQGAIRAENRSEGGARFVITLPGGEPPVAQGKPAAQRESL